MKNEKAKIYTIATAHLDTSWLWTYEKTISQYIPDTFRTNFSLIDKFPGYKFNFEGSLRYELLKEYYPEEFEKAREYIKQGKWNPCGSCFENGDVNIPSPEALIRNILYGNGFFRREFGVESNDIFLPDCFGFGKALPSVSAHSGLTGFSTGKLAWGCAVPTPFDVGRWNGPDGNGVWCALKPFSYTTLLKNPRKNERIIEKLKENQQKYSLDCTFNYHGNGDRGGAPHKKSIKAVCDAAKENANSETEVLSASTKEFFDTLENLPAEKKAKIPVWNGEFLMTEHGAGSYTSRTVTKRWNRRCEQLADAAERFSGAAFVGGLAAYPQYGLDKAWKNVIAHHFHDDITGTSFEKCYKRSHNDYVQAMNTFSAEYTAAVRAISRTLDTSFCQGIPVIVSNPLQSVGKRCEAVSVTVESEDEFFAVFDKDGNEVPSQSVKVSEKTRKITFLAAVSSVGLAVYDIRTAQSATAIKTDLKISRNSIENKNVAVTIDANGDISSVFDKRLGKELLKKPIRLAILNDVYSFIWPAWEIKYQDVISKPYMYAAKPEITVTDEGAALCAMKIVRTAGKSEFTQIISLDPESESVSVYNETDWREEASLLKAEFCLAAENENANYDIGIGYTERGVNTKSLYEVPAQKWADITDKTQEFGVSVFSDSRAGWDKPDLSTIRLTVAHTPMASYRWECSQHIMDMGINRYSFAICGHSGKPDGVTALADRFNQPMHTFVTEKHSGADKEFSFATVSNDKVRISAIKKAQESDMLILRLCECSGAAQSDVETAFSLPIKEAFEIRGDEIKIGGAAVCDGKLRFDMKANEIKSFALVFDSANGEISAQQKVALPFNAVGITDNNSKEKSTLRGGVSLPAEITPEALLYAGVSYALGGQGNNCLVCDGGEIKVPEGADTVHFLLSSLDGDRKAGFVSGGKAFEITVPDCFEAVGHWDLMRAKETGYIKPQAQALTLSHTHGKNGDMIAKQFYVFHAEVPVCGGKVKLPDDKNIVIFSASATANDYSFAKGDRHFDTLEKRKFDYEFSDYAVKHMNPNKVERFLDKFIDRTFSANIRTIGFNNKYGVGELYFGVRFAADKLFEEKRRRKIVESRRAK